MSTKKKTSKGNPAKHNYDLQTTVEDAVEVPNEGEILSFTEEALQGLLLNSVQRGQILGQSEAFEVGMQLVDSYLVRNKDTIKKKTAEALQELYADFQARHLERQQTLQDLIDGDAQKVETAGADA